MGYINKKIKEIAENAQPRRPTRKQLAQQGAEAAKAAAVQAPIAAVNLMNQGYSALWENPSVSPQEVLTEMGTDAQDIIESHTKLATFLATNLPDIAPLLRKRPEGYNITFPGDGTAIIVEPPA